MESVSPLANHDSWNIFAKYLFHYGKARVVIQVISSICLTVKGCRIDSGSDFLVAILIKYILHLHAYAAGNNQRLKPLWKVKTRDSIGGILIRKWVCYCDSGNTILVGVSFHYYF